jgi:DNA-binding NarL/FixJ family response regulator
MRLLLAHRPGIFRELFCAFLRGAHPLDTLKAVGDGIEFLQELERAAPDMVFVDADLPGLDGISAVMEARRRGQRARAMILSTAGHQHGEELLRALRAGITAYLAPDDGLAEFRLGMQAMVDRTLYVSPAALAGRDLSELLLEAHHQAPPIDRLTTREKEVLQLVSEGLTSTEIASRLCISASTVDGYRSRLMLKTRSHSVVDLLHWSQAAWSSC